MMSRLDLRPGGDFIFSLPDKESLVHPPWHSFLSETEHLASTLIHRRGACRSADRASTVATSQVSLSLVCASCHDSELFLTDSNPSRI